jgi:Xaa-Pro aminopeptidase
LCDPRPAFRRRDTPPPSSKRIRQRDQQACGADALVISDQRTTVAWAFNVRGSDVAHTPLPLVLSRILPKEDRPIWCSSTIPG